MKQIVFYDTETCGLHGMCILIQYAIGDGPVRLYSVWLQPIARTLKLIRGLMNRKVVGFNLTFDHFHLCKLYTIFSLCEDHSKCPIDIIPEIVNKEPLGRDGPCLKPLAACDIMLHARKGKYQSVMPRAPIKIKKVPTIVAEDVQEVLEETIKLDDIYFAKRADRYAPKWKIEDTKDPEFKDIVLRFKPSGALKTLVKHALGVEETIEIGSLKLPQPEEYGYAPFAKALPKRAMSWFLLIKRHISKWAYNSIAREYASNDVIYTREMWKHLNSPEPGDDDSELACMVGAVRWKGYKINIDGVKKLKEQDLELIKNVPIAPRQVQIYLKEVMSPVEQLGIETSTKKIILEQIALWEDHPAAERAQKVLNARQAKSRQDLYNKLLTAGRFHASFDVIGALSSRMSGRGGDLNPQGIKNAKIVREQFPLASDGMILCGGDFWSFELVIADAVYGDSTLREDLTCGKKVHGIFGTVFYPPLTYEQIINSEEKYTRSKSGVFLILYGGKPYGLMTRLGVDEKSAEVAFNRFMDRYKKVKSERETRLDKYCPMKQPNGIGTRVEWHTPSDYVESIFGFRRYFTLENKICKVLFDLANNPPKKWKQYKGKIIRREREQTFSGAVQSALYAAAFNIQSHNMRAAGNHDIQSAGATITKHVQRKIWDIQPTGIHDWIVQPMNIHDEIECPTKPDYVKVVETVVERAVNDFKDKVPLLKIEWQNSMKTWADK